MKTAFQNKTALLFRLTFSLILLVFISCKKDSTQTNTENPSDHTPDLTTKVNSSVSGFVTDQNNAAVAGATVKAGTTSIATDSYGYFEIKNVQLVKEAATVTVTYPGYFTTVKTFIGVENKAAFFRIKLLQKTIAGTVNAVSGGNISLSNGTNISFPANGIKEASGGAAYNGTVNIALQYIDPTSTQLNIIMPGDLRGIDANGYIRGLTSYGMLAVELTGDAGQLLQIADGKKATLTSPIPASASSNAPATIPLWYFNETTGLWKEEGTATKTGSTYTGDVSHFSFWNFDVPFDYIQVDMTIKDALNNPLANTWVVISDANNPINNTQGFTDANGYLIVAVPTNKQLQLAVHVFNSCNTPVYTQSIATATSNISLGTITISIPSPNNAVISGTVTDCSNAPVTNGHIMMIANNVAYYHALSATGTFNFVQLVCGSENAVFIAFDDANSAHGSPAPFLINTGNNVVPDLQICPLSTNEFINLTVDATHYTFTPPLDTILNSGTPGATGVTIETWLLSDHWSKNMTFVFYTTNLTVGSVVEFQMFLSNDFPPASYVIATPTYIHITECGATGEYVAGYFAGEILDHDPPNAPHQISGDFRVKRLF